MLNVFCQLLQPLRLNPYPPAIPDYSKTSWPVWLDISQKSEEIAVWHHRRSLGNLTRKTCLTALQSEIYLLIVGARCLDGRGVLSSNYWLGRDGRRLHLHARCYARHRESGVGDGTCGRNWGCRSFLVFTQNLYIMPASFPRKRHEVDADAHPEVTSDWSQNGCFRAANWTATSTGWEGAFTQHMLVRWCKSLRKKGRREHLRDTNRKSDCLKKTTAIYAAGWT